VNERITAGATALMTSLAGLTQITRVWPAPTGRHRRVPDAQRVPGAAFDQALRHCAACGRTTAVVVHADGSHTCTEGHTSRVGGVQ
jgi:hypothetical protein